MYVDIVISNNINLNKHFFFSFPTATLTPGDGTTAIKVESSA